MRRSAGGLTLVALLGVACGGASQPAEPATPARPPEVARTWCRYPLAQASYISVSAFSAAGEHPLRVDDVSGVLTHPAGAPAKARVYVRADLRSLTASSATVADVARSDSVLNVERFPESTFSSRSVRLAENGRLRVRGQLVLRGLSGEVTVDLEVTRTARELRASGEFELSREELGLDFAGLYETLAHDRVVVRIRAVAPADARPECAEDVAAAD